MHVALPAESALDFSGKAAGVESLVGQRAELPASLHLGLHKIEGFFVNDRFMGVLLQGEYFAPLVKLSCFLKSCITVCR